MNRSWLRTGVLMAFAFCVIVLPHTASANTFFPTPIFPAACHCDNQPNPSGGDPITTAPDYGCILQVIQNLVTAGVGLGVLLCVIWIAYAGFSLMISGGSPEARSQGKTRLLNAVVGIAVILCSWIIVDFVLKVVYNPSAAFEGGTFGPWNDILAGTSDNQCIKATNPIAIFSGTVDILTGNPGNTSATTMTGPASGDCSPAAITNDWGGDPKKGALFSCIINNESKCQNIATKAASTVAGTGSSAGGRYQVTMQTGPAGQTMNFPACLAVAKQNGFTGSALNCSSAYPNGMGNGTALAQQCRAAQLDPTCNTQAAQYLYAHGGTKAWLGGGDIGGKNQSCVTQYGT